MHNIKCIYTLKHMYSEIFVHVWSRIWHSGFDLSCVCSFCHHDNFCRRDSCKMIKPSNTQIVKLKYTKWFFFSISTQQLQQVNTIFLLDLCGFKKSCNMDITTVLTYCWIYLKRKKNNNFIKCFDVRYHMSLLSQQNVTYNTKHTHMLYLLLTLALSC